nr:hypothetical protein [Lachnospiraceae bacterium]
VIFLITIIFSMTIVLMSLTTVTNTAGQREKGQDALAVKSAARLVQDTLTTNCVEVTGTDSYSPNPSTDTMMTAVSDMLTTSENKALKVTAEGMSDVTVSLNQITAGGYDFSATLTDGNGLNQVELTFLGKRTPETGNGEIKWTVSTIKKTR